MSERQDSVDVSLSVKNEEDVSPESLAWADSCIISFPDDSDNNDWGTFRDALTEIIDIHPQIFVPTETTTTTNVRSRDEVMTEAEPVHIPQAAAYSSSNEQVSEIVSFLTFESDPSKNSLQDHYFPTEKRRAHGPVDNHTTGIESIEKDGSVSNDEEPESGTSKVFKDDFMSSSYVENTNADEVDVLEVPVNITPQDIFKVWDLQIVEDDDDDAEEDGLGIQVKKALDEFSTVLPRNDDEDHDHVVVEESNIDDLISGITDLSLTETFE